MREESETSIEGENIAPASNDSAARELTRWIRARRQPVLSIVMPVRNEVQSIARTLGQLLAQDFDPRWYEIIVVDGESTDDTRNQVAAIASQHPNVRLLTNPQRLSSAARNIGVRASQGELILIVDGHCEIKSPWLFRNVVQSFRESGADCLGRPQPLDVSEANALQHAIAVARSSWLGHHPDSFVYSESSGFVPAHSVAVAYRREVFDRVGYFDETFDACEDVEFNTRIDNAGLRCYFTPSIAVHYVPRATLSGLFKQLSRYGRGRVRLMRKHRETFAWKTIVAIALICGVLMLTPASLLSHWMQVLSLVGLVTYGVLIGIACCGIVLSRWQWSILPWLPLVFATIHAASGWGAVTEAARFSWVRDRSRKFESKQGDAGRRDRPSAVC